MLSQHIDRAADTTIRDPLSTLKLPLRCECMTTKQTLQYLLGEHNGPIS